MKNFSYTITEGEHAGKTLWSGRYCAVAAFVFCKFPDSGWHVLANKRGPGTPNYQGYWNCPCGYLEGDETGPQGCMRETYEETGVNIPEDMFKLVGVATDPKVDKNVTLQYMVVINYGEMSISVSNNHSPEEDEVETVSWIALDKVDTSEWAFNHNNIIKELSELLNE